MPSDVRPGPQPGNAPPQSPAQQVVGNGRPKEKASITSPGQVEAPPPVPQVGFRQSWPGMHDQAAPQPIAELGKPAYNPLTGEWFHG